jgi:RimJ/RimL family protein N-acetyltransferase
MYYKHENIEIEPFDYSTAKYIKAMNNPELNKYTTKALREFTEEEGRRYIEQIENDSSRIDWAVFDNNMNGPGRHVGNISLQQIDYHNRRAEIAFFIWEMNKGYGSMAGELVLKHAFNKLGLNSVWLGTINPHMEKLAKKLKMSLTGVYRQAIRANNKWNDIKIYDILADEYGQK